MTGKIVLILSIQKKTAKWYSPNYEEKEKGQTLKFEDLSLDAPLLGLEPRTP